MDYKSGSSCRTPRESFWPTTHKHTCMKFIDRVSELKRLVREKKEVPLDDLASILQVSPNYARDLKKEALGG